MGAVKFCRHALWQMSPLGKFLPQAFRVDDAISCRQRETLRKARMRTKPTWTWYQKLGL